MFFLTFIYGFVKSFALCWLKTFKEENFSLRCSLRPSLILDASSARQMRFVRSFLAAASRRTEFMKRLLHPRRRVGEEGKPVGLTIRFVGFRTHSLLLRNRLFLLSAGG